MAEEKKRFVKAEYDVKFHRENYTSVSLRFRNTDTEIIGKLNSVPNKVDYIRQLILADIQKEKEANK